MEHDQEWKERSVDYDHEWKERSKDCNPTGTDNEEQSAATTSNYSIPSLESTFNDHRYNHPIASPIQSTGTAITDGSSRSKESIPSNSSFQSKDSFKSPHRKYIFNNFIIIFILRLLFLLCGKSLFSAIFKIGSIVCVTYQEQEKLDFIK